ncbi:hypothetical protein K402DRAFT_416350 [Aulographum hederae CBS 113979]|uniref:DUF7729 domain-containing protein n=1 Tax=Aulographum hederae CBS 113979 TaxID=1176131 RepID=A0A6G1HFJ6_9PEZI|nr:hypothetical protein K402DRAFT_416350 [Aulographum hederae CBS 113979]
MEPTTCRAPRTKSTASRHDHWDDWAWNASCHHKSLGRPRRATPSRHNSTLSTLTAPLSVRLNLLLLVLLLWSLLCSPTDAASQKGDRRRSALASIASPGELLVDRSEPPTPPSLRMPHQERDTGTVSTVTVKPAQSTLSFGLASTAVSNGSPTTATASASIFTAPSSASDSPLPVPFDTNLGNNFTSTTCPNFFDSFLNNADFKTCYPFSLLLGTSTGFFAASKSLVRITRTLDATCNVDFDKCSALMARLGQQIQSENVCGAEFRATNPPVLQAYDGFIAYQTMYQAACLRDTNGQYCFADAITNTSSTSDAYPYYLPVGVDLPGGSRPTCNKCLKDTMIIFAGSASNATQPISQTYGNAAQQINIGCGPEFVNDNVMVNSGSSTVLGLLAGGGLPRWVVLLTLLIVYFS